MKYLVIGLLIIGFIGSAFGQSMGDISDRIWLPNCPIGTSIGCDQSSLFPDAIALPFFQSDSVAVGTIVEKNSQNQDSIRYSIDVDFYLKNYRPFDLITATLINPPEPQTLPEVFWYNSPVFNEDDLVFVYLKKNEVGYRLLPESFALDKHEVRGPPPTIHWNNSPSEDIFDQGEKILVSGEVRKMELVKATKENKQLNAILRLVESDDRDNMVFSDIMEISYDGNYSYFLDSSKIPPGNYELEVNYGPSTYGNGITITPNFKIWTPLKQISVGVSMDEIQCRENLVLVQKYDRSPACVKPETKLKLDERGWTIINQTTNDLLLNHFSNLSEVVAFYEVYEDAEFLLNEDHISYFSGSDDDYFARMNLFFDENYSINGMDFHCYYQRVHQYELPQEDIASKIAEYDCKEHEKFEGPESTITEDETISENSAPYTTYDVSGFKQTYMVGEPISFTETIQGFNNPCISTHYEILDGSTLESVWEYKIVYPCPYIKDPQQFKKIISIPNESISSPILNQTGPFIFRSYHSYSDNFTEVKFSVVDLDMDSNKPVPDSGSLFIPQGHVLGDAHEHASILVKIFGDKFDFSNPDFQIRSSWIHFEGLDGITIHRHSKGITLGYLFDTLNLKLTSDCFVFVNGREFCTNQDYSLKFFINGIQVDGIRDYVVSQGDRILISYGSEDLKEIQEQFDELNSQEIID
jgi:hypothetical protein